MRRIFVAAMNLSEVTTTDEIPVTASRRAHVVRVALVVALTMVMGTLVAMHVSGVNGPAYWQWPWRRLPGGRLVLGMAIAAVPFVVAQWLWAKGQTRAGVALALLVLASFLLQVVAVGMESRPFGLHPVGAIVRHPYCSGYFTEALQLAQRDRSLRDWLANYPEEMKGFYDHPRIRGPGIILYHDAFICTVGSVERAAIAAGLGIALLAALAAPATFGLVRLITGDRESAFCAASMMTLAPGLLLVMPQFDQVYPLATAALVALWVLALERDRFSFAAAFGAVLAIVCLFTYNLLVLGIFFAGYGVIHVARRGRSRWRKMLTHAGVAVLAFDLVYLLLYLATGFNAAAVFAQALRNQADFLDALKIIGKTRPWPETVPFDLADFAMASAWIGILLAGFYFFRRGAPRSPAYAVAILAAVQIVGTALSGLLQAETFRVYVFLLPLLMLPVGLELRHWRPGERAIVFACAWLLLATIAQNVTFNNWRIPVDAPASPSPTAAAVPPGQHRRLARPVGPVARPRRGGGLVSGGRGGYIFRPVRGGSPGARRADGAACAGANPAAAGAYHYIMPG